MNFIKLKYILNYIYQKSLILNDQHKRAYLLLLKVQTSATRLFSNRTLMYLFLIKYIKVGGILS